MLKKEKIIFISIALFSFLVNSYFASRGVFPIDTFIHYDSGYRILLGELPVRDYWIVHGFIIDFIQAFFFLLFGNNWYAYILHSSIFNLFIAIFTYYFFNELNINKFFSVILSICIALLAYPVSGTPFLDLHSSFFSLFSVYIIILAIKKNKEIYWFYSSLLLCTAFFSKQVPAFYLIILLLIINLYICFLKKNFKILLYFFFGGFFFLTILTIFLLLLNINIYDFIVQIFLFPKSIGLDRYINYNLNFKNIFLDFKLIYVLLIPISAINFYLFIKKKIYYSSNNFIFFLIILAFVFSSLFHQIYTKNQIYIFFVIPILAGMFIYFLDIFSFKNKRVIFSLILLFTIFSTIKYTIRFDINRKFHELVYTNISKSVDAKIIDKKLAGLNWISPYYSNAENEIFRLKYFISILESEKDNIMLITEYNLFSALLEKKFYSPSRTYDDISYPSIENNFYEYYRSFLVDKIYNNKIKKIYFFSKNNNFSEQKIIFDYISKDCFEKNNLTENIMFLKVIKCKIF